MSDSLDDFFAKKDKKRGKDKGKTLLSAEALVRELEEGAKQVEYTARKENKTSTAVELLGLDADDAGWKDFEDIEKRDYSGLKVKEMSLQDQNEEEQRRLTSEQVDALPESTPWKVKDETPAIGEPSSTTEQPQKDEQQQQPQETTTTKDTQESSDNTSVKKAYVPPHARGTDGIKLLEPTRLSKLKTVGGVRQGPTPDIQDERLFPSLG